MPTRPPVRLSRRGALRGAVAGGGGLLFGGGLGFLSQLQPVSADDAKLPTNLVNFDTGIEPTVRLLEDTPRERLLEEVAARVKGGGLSYRELLAALQLAGVRNVQPRPAVGFKFHAVLVINSAHLASQASPDADRWLPIFWALDRFKGAQAETAKDTGWRMGAVDELKVPPADKAADAFRRAMDAWDEDAADVAAAAVARSAGRNAAFELFARYGARDFRDIGHKAIYVANSFRTLEAIGWQHAEPVLRSLAYALLKREKENPSQVDLAPDRPWRRNAELVKTVRPDWQTGKPDAGATKALLSAFRTASDQEACEAVVKAINAGVAVSSVWDAVLAASSELLMRKTGILTLHAVTTANALRFAYEASGDPQTRLLMLLQNAAFTPLFRNAAGVGDKPGLVRIDEFEPAPAGADHGDKAVAEVFAAAGKDRPAAASAALSFLDQGGRPNALADAGRRLVFLKGRDAHDYKFSSAVFEDYAHVAPPLRNRCLAASLHYLPSSAAPDTALVGRTRAALGG